MVIDIITERNTFNFLRFLGKEFSGDFFALCSEKFSECFTIEFQQSKFIYKRVRHSINYFCSLKAMKIGMAITKRFFFNLSECILYSVTSKKGLHLLLRRPISKHVSIV